MKADKGSERTNAPFAEPEGTEPVSPACGDDGRSSVVLHTPQCVGCANNQGGFRCSVFVRKPEELLMNQADCPARKTLPGDA